MFIFVHVGGASATILTDGDKLKETLTPAVTRLGDCSVLLTWFGSTCPQVESDHV